MLTVSSAMYILAALLTPVAFVMLLLLLLLQVVQPRVPTIIVLHVHCTCPAALPDEPNDEQENEDYWHTPVQETQHP